MRIGYKTRGGSAVQGKAKVWIARCNDSEEVLDEISDDILTYRNCSLWYDEEPASKWSEEELFSVLSDMRLVVIPVITDMFTEENRVLGAEYKLAKKLGIPVLPILLEEGLDSLFNESFNSLQCLDKTLVDTTTMSYGDKLKKYLDNTLCSDELIERIQAAFTDSVFLSYRKKDRRYVRKIMEQVHTDDRLRAVAVWYDEYLIPGESFGDAIMSKLEESSLFMLAVTPSLLERENYVMRVEYPKAKTLDKPIVPIEVTPTDRAELSEAYYALPEVLTIADADSVKDRIIGLLDKWTHMENDRERLYLLALAYLNGIGVETDAKYAVSALCRSALLAYPSAIEELAIMYRYGIGVGKDMNDSCKWYMRLACVRRLMYNDDNTEENLLEYARAYEEAGDMYYDLGRYGSARDSYRSAIDVLVGYDGSDSWMQSLAELYEKMGLSYKSEMRLEDAAKYYEMASDLFFDMEETERSLRSVVTLSYRLGDVHLGMGNDDIAAGYYESCLDDAELFEAHYPSENSRRLICVALEKLGDFAVHTRNSDDAIRYYSRYANEARALTEEFRSLSSKRLYAISLERMGNLALKEEEYEKAEKYYKASLAVKRDIFKDTASYEAMRDVAVGFQKLGNLSLENYETEDARKHYQRALDISSELYEATNAADVRFDAAVNIEKLGETALVEDDESDEALKLFSQAYELYCEIDESLWNAPLTVKKAPATALDFMGVANMRLGRLDDAEECFDRALELRKRLYRSYGTKELLSEISTSFNHLSHLAIEQGDFKSATIYGAHADAPEDIIRNESYSSNARMSFDDDDDFLFGDEEKKDEAQRALDCGEYERAIELYLEVIEEDPYACRGTVVANLEECAFALTHRGGKGKLASAGRVWEMLGERLSLEPVYTEMKQALRKLI